MPHDSLPPPPPPPPDQTVPQASPYLLHGQSKVVPPTAVHTIVPKDTHTRVDSIKQLRVSDNLVVWDDLDSIPMGNLLDKFRMPDIERYMGVGCPYIHFRLYNTVMRAHGLDES